MIEEVRDLPSSRWRARRRWILSIWLVVLPLFAVVWMFAEGQEEAWIYSAFLLAFAGLVAWFSRRAARRNRDRL